MLVKRVFCIFGMIAGIALAVVGFNFKIESWYSGTDADEYVAFGADFYTEQYQATAYAANNVDALGDYEQNVNNELFENMSLLIMVSGIIVFCYFGSKIGETMIKEKKDPIPVHETVEQVSESLPEI